MYSFVKLKILAFTKQKAKTPLSFVSTFISFFSLHNALPLFNNFLLISPKKKLLHELTFIHDYFDSNLSSSKY